MTEVDLYFAEVPEAGFAEILPRIASELTEREIEAAHRFVFERHRILYAASHAFLRRTLATKLGCPAREVPIVGAPGERPELADRTLRFNLSHTAGLVLVGVTASADLGVDVENVDRRTEIDVLAPAVFTPEECSAWDGSRESFFDRWTLKESYIKARGLGLRMDLQTFGVTLDPPPRLVCAPSVDVAAGWQLHSFEPSPRHRAAAAVRASDAVRWVVHAPRMD